MKSIKEKAKEVERNTHPLFESISESTGEPVSVYDQNDMIDMFEAGANYVLDEIESIIKDASEEYPRFQQGAIIHGRLIKLLEQLKK